MENELILEDLQKRFLTVSVKLKYTYNFTWLGFPIIQFPQDILAMQEIICNIKPDLIIETGIAHGGSLIFYASILELLGHGEVLGIDIDIREHNRKAIQKHFLFKRITMIQGSSIDEQTIKQVKTYVHNKDKILVALDANHTHDHVLQELQLYSPLVSKDSYLVVFDTSIENLPENTFSDRPWNKGNNPKTAVWEFLKTNDRFIIDKTFNEKLICSANIDGYLKCIKNPI